MANSRLGAYSTILSPSLFSQSDRGQVLASAIFNDACFVVYCSEDGACHESLQTWAELAGERVIGCSSNNESMF